MRTCTSGTTYAVNISLFILWALIVDYVCNSININSACSNIGCNKNI